MSEWKDIVTMDDINELAKIYHDFEDSLIVRFTFESGNYVDDQGVGHGYDTNNLVVLFQRMDKNPFSIEILFEGTGKINFLAPVPDVPGYDWVPDILYAKLTKDEDFFYWTLWKDFDPYNEEHLQYNDFILIQAKKVKWRVVS